jgi:hypothetical protein
MSKQSFASAVRSATFVGDDNVKNPGSRGVKVTLDVTSVPTVDTVQLVIEHKDVVSGKYVQVGAAAARVAVGTDVLTVYPGIAVTANVAISDVLGDIYRVRVVHSAATNFTYSIGVAEIA